MSFPVEHIAKWLVSMVEAGKFKNPIPYPPFRTTINKWIKSDDQFDNLAQAVIAELLKQDIHVMSNRYSQQQSQQDSRRSLVINAHDDNSTFKLIAWLYDIIGKAHNNKHLKQICFSVDFKEA